jgi:membrane carboxypeptidase/penicillin-binding protein
MYFDKPLSGLSETEFIQLVAMLKAPSYYHPVNGATQLQDRALKISRILSGECEPDGWFDTSYEHCSAILKSKI